MTCILLPCNQLYLCTQTLSLFLFLSHTQLHVAKSHACTIYRYNKQRLFNQPPEFAEQVNIHQQRRRRCRQCMHNPQFVLTSHPTIAVTIPPCSCLGANAIFTKVWAQILVAPSKLDLLLNVCVCLWLNVHVFVCCQRAVEERGAPSSLHDDTLFLFP